MVWVEVGPEGSVCYDQVDKLFDNVCAVMLGETVEPSIAEVIR